MTVRGLEAAVAAEAEEQRRRVANVLAWEPLDEADVEAVIADRLGPVDAVPTPLPSWNGACRDEGGGVGMARGWSVILAGATGDGKSVMAANVARTAVEAGETVGYVSLEMSRAQLRTRFWSVLSGEPVRTLERGRSFDADALRRAHGAVVDVRDRTGGRFVDGSRPVRHLGEVEDAMMELVQGHGARTLIVDYLQLAALSPNDPDAIARVSHRVRDHTFTLNVTTLGLSQFNRGGSTADDGPTIHGLHGSSSLENDADQVVLLDFSRTQQAPAPARGWHTHVVIGKNRHGPRADIAVAFDSDTLRYRELAPDEEPAWEAGR